MANNAAPELNNAALAEMFRNRSANVPFKEWFMGQLDNPDLPPPHDLLTLDFDIINNDYDADFIKKIRKDARISSKAKKSEREKDAFKAIFLAICKLTNLESLTLLGLKTEIPSEIGNLRELMNLSISRSGITSLPDTIGNLNDLVELNLGANRITRLPDSIGNLRDLRVLDLNNNNITELPDSFGNLSRLESLYLAGNQLTTLPESFGNLVNLKRLYLESNQISALPTDEDGEPVLYSFHNLESFNMNGNPINDTNPEISHNIEEMIETMQELRIVAQLNALHQENAAAPVPAGPGLAFQVHNAFSKINKAALFEFLGDDTPLPIFNTNEAFIEYINTELRELINTLPEENERKAEILPKYQTIYDNILSKVEYTAEYKKIILNALKYVKKQPLLFKQNYIYYFVYDTYHAYNGQGSTLSCAKGAIERFIFALKSAAEIVRIENAAAFNTNDYEELITLVSPKTLKQSINEYAQECIQSDRVTSKPTKDEKKAELKICIREKVVASFGENAITNAINTSINETIEGLNSMLNNNVEGGRRKKQAKTRGKVKTGKAKTKRRGYRFRKTQKKYRK